MPNRTDALPLEWIAEILRFMDPPDRGPLLLGGGPSRWRKKSHRPNHKREKQKASKVARKRSRRRS